MSKWNANPTEHQAVFADMTAVVDALKKQDPGLLESIVAAHGFHASAITPRMIENCWKHASDDMAEILLSHAMTSAQQGVLNSLCKAIDAWPAKRLFQVIEHMKASEQQGARLEAAYKLIMNRKLNSHPHVLDFCAGIQQDLTAQDRIQLAQKACGAGAWAIFDLTWPNLVDMGQEDLGRVLFMLSLAKNAERRADFETGLQHVSDPVLWKNLCKSAAREGRTDLLKIMMQHPISKMAQASEEAVEAALINGNQATVAWLGSRVDWVDWEQVLDLLRQRIARQTSSNTQPLTWAQVDGWTSQLPLEVQITWAQQAPEELTMTLARVRQHQVKTFSSTTPHRRPRP